MIPRRNLSQLMLRSDVVQAVRDGQFHVWAVCSIEEGLQVLTSTPPGSRAADGSYPRDSVFGRVDVELQRLADGVARYGPADAGPLG